MQVDDYEVSEKFDPHKGEGIEFEYEGREYVGARAETPREVHAEITTWVGSDWNATHYYGTLKVRAVDIRYREQVNEGGSVFPGGADIPKEIDDIKVDITYAPNEKERKELNNEPGAFGIGKRCQIEKGARTTRFTSKEKLRKRIDEEFERLFGPGWILKKRYEGDE